MSISFNLLYWIGKINGLVPFKMSYNPTKALCSNLTLAYSLLYFIAMLYLLPHIQYTVVNKITMHDKLVVTLVFLLQVILSCFQYFVIYFNLIYNRHRYVRLINEAIVIEQYHHQLLAKSATVSSVVQMKNIVVGFVCKTLYRWKIVAIIVQVICLLIPIYGFTKRSHDITMTVKYIFIVYVHIIKLYFGLIYFCGLLFSYQMYCILNVNVNRVVNDIVSVSGCIGKKQMKMQMYCTLSDCIDEIGVYFVKISDFLNDLMNLYSMPLIVCLLDSFIVILNEVHANLLKRNFIQILLYFSVI